MNESWAREEICRVGKSLYERGYVHAAAGNISVRLDDGYLITPTDACLGSLDPARLARTDMQGRQTSGDKASKTLTLHTRIYESTRVLPTPARCVLHTHSSHCVALTLLPHGAELLPPITPYFVMKVGHVPVLPYYRPGDPVVADLVAATIARYLDDGIALRSVMLSRLGPNVWSETPASAMATLEELEETARLWQACAHGATALTELQIEELRKLFGAQW